MGCVPLCSYPHSLFFLELLQSEDFRKSIASTAVKVHYMTGTLLQIPAVEVRTPQTCLCVNHLYVVNVYRGTVPYESAQLRVVLPSAGPGSLRAVMLPPVAISIGFRRMYAACAAVFNSYNLLQLCRMPGLFQDLVHSQQFFFWQHYRANRVAAADGASHCNSNRAGQQTES